MRARTTVPGQHRSTNAGSDRLLRSSLFLAGTSGAMTILGFGSTLIVTRLFTPEQVGSGTTLISAATLIGYLSLVGLNMSVVRFYSDAENRPAYITQSLFIVGGLGALMAGMYVLLVPLYAPALSFVRSNLLYALGFVIVCALVGINLMTDAVFVAARKAEYNLFIDGLLQGVIKLVLPVALIGLGAYGVFAATGGGYLVAVAVSVLCMWRALGFRFDFRRRVAITRAHVSYSFASYISNALAVVPTMVLPLMALRGLGSAETAYLTVALQIAFALYGVSFAIGEALFAEGSFDESRLPSLLKRSGRLLVMVQVPALILVAVAGPFALGFFGEGYRQHGGNVLVILAIAAIPVALHTWADFALRLLGLMKSLVASGVVCAAVTVVFAHLWGDRGLEWFGWAILIGTLVSGLYGLAVIVVHQWKRKRETGELQPYEGAGVANG